MREPSIEGYDELLQQNQGDFIASNSSFLDNLANKYNPTFDEYTNNVQEAQYHHDDPHDKRELRIQAWADLMEEGAIYNETWLTGPHSFMYKMKRGETAKPGKVARGIADLGVSASLQAFRGAYFLKKAMAEEVIEVEGGIIEFCPKPSPTSLIRIFEELKNPSKRFYFVYFSDDSCLSIRTEGGRVLRFNVDISSCDASHTKRLFDALIRITPENGKETMRQAVNQCKQPITVRSRADPKNKVTLKPTGPRLYSGSSITTVINNLANILIAYAIAGSTINSKEDVSSAAESVGYIVTCIDCTEDWHLCQFLKHSPVMDSNGELRALLNIGVLLRTTGVCTGDLPGKKTEPWEERAKRFQQTLLQGLYPRAKFNLIDNMKKACVTDIGAISKKENRQLSTMVAKITDYKVYGEDEDESFIIESSEVFKRYGLNDLQIAEIELDFGRMGYEEHYHSSGTAAILKLDYGLSGKSMPA